MIYEILIKLQMKVIQDKLREVTEGETLDPVEKSGSGD